MNEREFQLETVKRAPLLDALSDRPKSMSDLNEALEMSRSTIHRALDTFDEQNVVRKSDHRYALTEFGRAVTDRTSEFSRELATVRELDDILNAADAMDVEIPLEQFADAEVVRPEPGNDHTGVDRIVDLIRASDSLRMFSNVLSPLYADVARREMIDGMTVEVIFDERIMPLLVSEYAEDAVEAFETDRFTVHFVCDVPFELFVSEDTMAMAVHDHSALPRIFVETGAEDAIDWAERLYERYEDRAEQFDPGRLTPPADADVLQAVDN